MNFISIFVVLGAVALCKHGVDANLRGDYLGLDDEHERFELLGRRRVLRRGYVPRFPLEDGFRHLMAVKPLSCCQSHSGQANMLGHCRHTGAPHLNSKSSIVLWHGET